MTMPTIPHPQQPVDHAKITGPFQYAEDIHDAMKDPRYSKDKAYEDRIDARLDQTAPEVFTTSRNAKVDEVEQAVAEERLARDEAERQSVLSKLDFSTVTPILDGAELIALMQDPRYKDPHATAYRTWVDLRLAQTPESLLGITTKVVDRQAVRYQMGRDE